MDDRCRCMTRVYGGIKRCRKHAANEYGWCSHHWYWNGGEPYYDAQTRPTVRPFYLNRQRRALETTEPWQ